MKIFNYFQWKSINELNKLQQLEEIRIVHNPIMDLATPETVRQMLVAKISTLKMCNRTEVKHPFCHNLVI